MNTYLKKLSAKKILLSMLCITMTVMANAQVGFNNPSPDSSSVVDIAATNKGFLLPRVTSAQRLAMKVGPPTLANSLMVYDTDSNAFFYWSNSLNEWVYLNAFARTAAANSNTILRNGNLGIGLLNPSAKLDVSGNIRIADGTQGAGKFLMSDANGFGSWVTQSFSEVDPKVGTLNSNKIPKWNNTSLTDGTIIDSAGFIGIGVTSATSKLNIAGTTTTTNLQITNGAANGFILRSDATGNATWVNSNTLAVTESDPKVGTLNSNKIPKWNGTALSDGLITDNGSNIGIGTSTPSGKLHIKGSADANQLVVDANTTQSNTNPLMLMRDNAGNPLLTIHSDHQSNVFIGRGSGQANVFGGLGVTGSGNTFIGGYHSPTNGVGLSNTTGMNNTALGMMALGRNTTGDANTAIGVEALKLNVSGTQNTALGSNALRVNTTGSNNMAVSSYALFGNTTGSGNIGLGLYSLQLNYSGNSNIGIGNYAGSNLKTGSNNLFIGEGTNTSDTNITNASAIGYGAIVGTSNSMVLGDANVKVGIGTSAPTQKLHVNGTIRMVDGNQGNGKVLTSDANGNASWQNASSGWGLTGNSSTNPSSNFMGTSDNQPIVFRTNNTEKMRVDTNGNVGLGFSNPLAKLDVNGDALINGIKTGRGKGSNLSNTVFGVTALDSNTTGLRNVAIGNSSLQSNTTGYENASIGFWSLRANKAGYSNASTGAYSLSKNTSGFENSSVGALALYENTTGGMNSVVGAQALWQNVSGGENVAIGYYAGNGNVTGSQNTYIGGFADATVDGLTNATALGYNAKVSISNALVLGSNANVGIGTSSPTQKLHVAGTIRMVDGNQGNGKVLTSDANGNASWQTASSGWGLTGNSGTNTSTNFIGTTDNQPIVFRTYNAEKVRVDTNGYVGIGFANPLARLDVNGDALINGLTVGKGKNSINGCVALGINALKQNVSGINNIAIGFSSLNSLNTASDNVAVGNSTLWQLTSGGQNVAIGGEALNNLSTGIQNTAVGFRSMFQTGNSNYNTGLGTYTLFANSGYGNTALGTYSLMNNTSASSNTATGYQTLMANISGGDNTANGTQALRLNTIGNYNTAVGSGALDNANLANNNTAIGYRAGDVIRGGSNNTFIGYQADAGDSTLTNVTAIGANTIVNTSNSIVLGNGVNVGIGTSAPTQKLHVAGTIRMVDGSQGNGKVLTSDANGNASWQTASAGWGLNGNSGTGASNFIGTTDNVSVRFGSNNTNYMTLDSLGRLNIGDQILTSSINRLNISNNGTAAVTTLTNFSNIASANPRMQLRRSRGTSVAPSSILSADWIGSIGMLGYDGTTFFSAAQIYSDATENWGASSHGAYLVFRTTPNGSSSATDRVKIDQNGYVGIGTTNPQALLDIAGPALINGISLGTSTASVNECIAFGGLGSNTTGSANTALGSAALGSNTTGSSNTAVGERALISNIGGQNNTAVGSYAGYNTTATGNVAIGNRAMEFNYTGNNNTAIGNGADVIGSALNNATAIGWNAKVRNNNSLILGDSATVNVGIGINAPVYKLHVQGNIYAISGFSSSPVSVGVGRTGAEAELGIAGNGGQYSTDASSGDAVLRTQSSTAKLLFGTGPGSSTIALSNGNVGVGMASPVYKLQVNGQPAANGFTLFTNYSDRRLKENIAPIDNILHKIMMLNPVEYNYNTLSGMDEATRAKKMKGFIAQEVKNIFPEMVGETSINGETYYDLNLSHLLPYMVKAMQEMKTENDALRKELDDMKNQNADYAAMKKDIEMLKQLLNTASAK